MEGHGNSLCTIGFVAIKDGTAGMVTAGHCNEGDPYNGGVNNQRFDQPSTINFIGYEDLDPPFSTSKPGCTDSDGCRYSDSTFIDFGSGVQYNRGWIAKPIGNGSITVHPDTAHYSIISDSSYALQNDTVLTIGRSSGQVQGNVSNTCVDKDDAGNVHWEGTYLCQVRVNTGVAGGDSGGPVFKIQSGDNVKLLGILTLGSSNTYIYSPIGKIFIDLSVSSTWDVCTSGC